MKIRYLEIVTPDVADIMAMLSASTGAKFSKPVAELCNARVTELPEGAQMGVRAPMHDGEDPVTRSYFQTDDIDAATQSAIDAGAELAVPVMELPGQGKFSLLFQGSNQFGFWQD